MEVHKMPEYELSEDEYELSEEDKKKLEEFLTEEAKEIFNKLKETLYLDEKIKPPQVKLVVKKGATIIQGIFTWMGGYKPGSGNIYVSSNVLNYSRKEREPIFLHEITHYVRNCLLKDEYDKRGEIEELLATLGENVLSCRKESEIITRTIGEYFACLENLKKGEVPEDATLGYVMGGLIAVGMSNLEYEEKRKIFREVMYEKDPRNILERLRDYAKKGLSILKEEGKDSFTFYFEFFGFPPYSIVGLSEIVEYDPNKQDINELLRSLRSWC
jgi:hypothetical protein